jgi:hypothetical protein
MSEFKIGDLVEYNDPFYPDTGIVVEIRPKFRTGSVVVEWGDWMGKGPRRTAEAEADVILVSRGSNQ